RTMDTAMIAVQGPKAVSLAQELTPGVDQLANYYAVPTNYRGKPCVVSRTGYTGEDGLEFIVSRDLGVALWEDLISKGAVPCGLGARDTLRLEAAMPLYGHELTEEINPFEAGLAWAVKLQKGDFVGRGALLLAREQVGRSGKQRVGLELEGR